MRTYFPVAYRLDKQTKYLIWYDDDADGVLTADGGVPVFRTLIHLRAFATEHALKLQKERPTHYDLDAVDRWRKVRGGKKSRYLKCNLLLDAWNLFGDISASTGRAFPGAASEANLLYQKLFYGLNLPSITPEGQHYTPAFSRAELQALRHICHQGLLLIRTATHIVRHLAVP